MCNVRAEDRIFTEKLRTRLNLSKMRFCLQDRRLMVFRHLGRTEEDNWCSKYRTFKVSGSFPRGRP